MELARRVFSRDLEISAMREIESGRSRQEVARQLELSPKLLERWHAAWRKRGEWAFPGLGRRTPPGPVSSEAERIAELERKIGQMTMENDFLKKALRHFKEFHPPAVVSGDTACISKSSKPQPQRKVKR